MLQETTTQEIHPIVPPSFEQIRSCLVPEQLLTFQDDSLVAFTCSIKSGSISQWHMPSQLVVREDVQECLAEERVVSDIRSMIR
jgi:hypothetical protein